MTAPGGIVDRQVSVIDGHIRFSLSAGPAHEGLCFSYGTKSSNPLEDDFDGSKERETILFALDGVEYVIDLNDAHAGELREVFSRYTKAARKTGGRARTARPGSSNAREVRLWAAGQRLQALPAAASMLTLRKSTKPRTRAVPPKYGVQPAYIGWSSAETTRRSLSDT